MVWARQFEIGYDGFKSSEVAVNVGNDGQTHGQDSKRG